MAPGTGTLRASRPTAPVERRSAPAPAILVARLAATQRLALLRVARTALAVAARTQPPAALDAALAAPGLPPRRAAAFVTLTTSDGYLRGCMGSLDAGRSVAQNVGASALLAALDDPRFPPVVAEELRELTVDVSVLGPCHPLAEPESFNVGREGIIVERDGRRGLLLPEVATHFGLDAAAMLDLVCLKAGLPRRSWRDPRTTVSAFGTIRFGGPAIQVGGIDESAAQAT
jgi:AmmeMemoRadiSam system protein A